MILLISAELMIALKSLKFNMETRRNTMGTRNRLDNRNGICWIVNSLLTVWDSDLLWEHDIPELTTQDKLDASGIFEQSMRDLSSGNLTLENYGK
jgi:hypothetical protein